MARARFCLASDEAVKRLVFTPKARIVASAAAGVAPRIMGMGPVPATRKALALAKLAISDMDVIELNEAFASQALAVLRELRNSGRCCACQSKRRSDFDRASFGRKWRPADCCGHAAIAAQRRTLRVVHHVHRSRPGHRDDSGARLAGNEWSLTPSRDRSGNDAARGNRLGCAARSADR